MPTREQCTVVSGSAHAERNFQGPRGCRGAAKLPSVDELRLTGEPRAGGCRARCEQWTRASSAKECSESCSNSRSVFSQAPRSFGIPGTSRTSDWSFSSFSPAGWRSARMRDFEPRKRPCRSSCWTACEAQLRQWLRGRNSNPDPEIVPKRRACSCFVLDANSFLGYNKPVPAHLRASSVVYL